MGRKKKKWARQKIKKKERKKEKKKERKKRKEKKKKEKKGEKIIHTIHVGQKKYSCKTRIPHTTPIIFLLVDPIVTNVRQILKFSNNRLNPSGFMIYRLE